MKFNITEVNGTKSPLEWFAQKIKEYAKDEHGLEVTVEVLNPGNVENGDLSDTR